MKKTKWISKNIFTICSIIITIAFGTLLHFVYEWSGNNPIVGLFSPVNESVWEHMKLLFYPASICFVIGYPKYGKHNCCYFFFALIGLIVGLIIMPLLFYLYTAVVKTNILILDISIFVISVITTFLIIRYLLKNYNICFLSNKAAIAIWELLFVLFVLFTIFPPDIPLFQSPQ